MIRTIARKLFDILLKTVFCLMLIYAFKFVFEKYLTHSLYKIEYLNPISNKIADFELFDFCLGYEQKGFEQDSNIIIINIKDNTEKEIARKISIIENYEPKSIGLDILFDSSYDSGLLDSIIKYKDNIILAADDSTPTIAKQFYQKLFERNKSGSFTFGYLPHFGRFSTIRTFAPFIISNVTIHKSFGLAIYQTSFKIGQDSDSAYYPASNQVFINYHKGLDNTPFIRIFDLYLPVEDDVKGKIVLFGMVEDDGIKDKIYTPLGNNYGKSLPDMDGVIYHAQCINNLIGKSFLSDVSRFNKAIYIFLFCFVFLFIYDRLLQYHSWYHFLVELIFLFFLIPASMKISLWFLKEKLIKIEPSTFILPIFFCGLALHLYQPFATRIVSFMQMFKKKKVNEK